VQSAPVKSSIRAALKAKKLRKGASLYEDALRAGVITAEELALLTEVQAMSDAVVQVDSYKIDDYLARH